MPLNIKQIEAARFGVQKERLSDGSGLYLRLYPNGAKRFQVQIPKEPNSSARGWVNLGAFPELSLKAARGLAAQAKSLVNEGLSIDDVRKSMQPSQKEGHARQSDKLDPAPQKMNRSQKFQPTQPQNDGILLKDAAKIWFDRKSATLSNGKHIDQNWNTLNTYILPKFGNRDIRVRTRSCFITRTSRWRRVLWPRGRPSGFDHIGLRSFASLSVGRT